jgi:hypothetical protein
MMIRAISEGPEFVVLLGTQSLVGNFFPLDHNLYEGLGRVRTAYWSLNGE